MNTYVIQLRGQIDVEELNPLSPHQMTLIQFRVEPAATLVTICTDQSGMIGLLGHLNNCDLAIQSVICQFEKEGK